MKVEQAAPTSEMRAGYIQVGTTAAKLTQLAHQFTNGVRVKANQANTGFIYVGDAAVSATNGFQLDAGEEVFLPVSDPSLIYIVGSSAGQDVSWIGV